MKKNLSARELYLYDRKKERRKIVFIRIFILLALILFWEISTAVGVVDSFFTSSPSRILSTLYSLFVSGEIWRHTAITMLECLLGFLISTVVGFFIAVLLWWSNTARISLEPYLVVLNALPKIALGPLIIIWVGAGIDAIVLMAFLICIIVTIMNLTTAFTCVDEGKIFLLRSMGASKFQILLKLIIPHSIPAFMDVVKVNVGLSWVGTIMGEYLVSGAGLGYLIIYGGQVFKIDLVMAATVILCVLAALMYALVSLVSRPFKRFCQVNQTSK